LRGLLDLVYMFHWLRKQAIFLLGIFVLVCSSKMVLKVSEARKTYIIEDLDKVQVDYDRSTDTLHIVFGEGTEEADEAILTENDVGYRIKGGRIIGVTIYGLLRRLGIEV